MTDAAAETAPCIQAQSTLMAGNYQNEAQALIRSACSECRRRKQKCLRYWPCHHCGTRRVGNQCIFRTVLDVQTLEDRKTQIDQFLSRMKGKCCFAHPFGEEIDGGSDNTWEDVQQFGYKLPDQEKVPQYTTQYFMRPLDCPELQTALRAFPSRECLDALVDNFLTNVNLHYYIVHPTVFRQEYNQWWNDIENENPLGSQWTALFLMTCACSAQRANEAVRQALWVDQGLPAHELSNRLHKAGSQLHTATTQAACHIYTLQQLLHSCLWLNTRVCYHDCVDVLASAIQVAKELGANREGVNSSVSSGYEKEMGRRAWIVINIWDWQIATLLTRSRILEDMEYDTRLPNFQLNKEPKESIRSPIVSMALQCELASSISKRFSKKAYEAMIARNRRVPIMRPYPPYLALLIGNYSDLDNDHRWRSLERFIVSTMHLSSALAPLRPYLIKPLSQASPTAELGLRQEGVSIAIKYMLHLFKFLRYLFPLHKKYQTVVFFIFDTATLLCSTIIHDSDASMPMRDQSWAAVQGTLVMLRTVKPYAPIANKAFEVLDLIYSEMLSQQTVDDEMRRNERPKVTAALSIWPLIHIRTSAASEGYNFTFEIPKNPRAYAPDMVPPLYSDVGYLSEPEVRAKPFGDRRQRTTAPLHPATLQLQPLHDNGDTAMADEPSSSSTEMFYLDGTRVILTQVNKPKKPKKPKRRKAVANRPSVKNSGYIPEKEPCPWVTGLGILEGLWDYDRVNLGILSPYLAN